MTNSLCKSGLQGSVRSKSHRKRLIQSQALLKENRRDYFRYLSEYDFPSWIMSPAQTSQELPSFDSKRVNSNYIFKDE